MKSKAQLVEDMLDILPSPEAWCKNLLETDGEYGPQRCLVGALNLAATGSAMLWAHIKSEVALAVLDAMDARARSLGYGGESPLMHMRSYATVSFNNAHETTYEDVRLFLKEILEEVS